MSFNKVTFISGASSGIGLAISHLFAKNGHDLILVARNGEVLFALASELRKKYQVQVATFVCDLSQVHQTRDVLAAIAAEKIFVEYVVNNAGVGDFGFFHDSEWPKIEHMIDVNIKSLTNLTHAFLQEMKKQNRGQILNIASVAAFQPGPLMAVYFATQAYVLHFGEAIRNELRKTNISITTVCPGPTQTSFAITARATNSTLFRGKKLPSADQVAEYAFLAMMQRKGIAIHGFKNKVFVFLNRLAPRRLMVQIMRIFTSTD